jgi:hypothetical protein
MKFTLEHDILKALLKVAAKNDIRYYLKGVLMPLRVDADAMRHPGLPAWASIGE